MEKTTVIKGSPTEGDLIFKQELEQLGSIVDQFIEKHPDCTVFLSIGMVGETKDQRDNVLFVAHGSEQKISYIASKGFHNLSIIDRLMKSCLFWVMR